MKLKTIRKRLSGVVIDNRYDADERKLIYQAIEAAVEVLDTLELREGVKDSNDYTA